MVISYYYIDNNIGKIQNIYKNLNWLIIDSFYELVDNNNN